jgi:hypothetical protein
MVLEERALGLNCWTRQSLNQVRGSSSLCFHLWDMTPFLSASHQTIIKTVSGHTQDPVWRTTLQDVWGVWHVSGTALQS